MSTLEEQDPTTAPAARARPSPALWTRLSSPRVLRFLVVGFSGVFVNLAALHVFFELLGLHRLLASAAAVEVSIVSNFLLNNAWTFSDRNAGAAAAPISRFVRYNLVSLVGMGIQLAVFEGTNQIVMAARGGSEPGGFVYPAQLLGIVVATAWNFTSNVRWTWAQSPREPSDA